jgi:hypothetical protein
VLGEERRVLGTVGVITDTLQRRHGPPVVGEIRLPMIRPPCGAFVAARMPFQPGPNQARSLSRRVASSLAKRDNSHAAVLAGNTRDSINSNCLTASPTLSCNTKRSYRRNSDRKSKPFAAAADLA